MTGKPWLPEHNHDDIREELTEAGHTEEWVAFFCAAPAMARALCRLEYGTLKEFDNHPSCPWCETFEGEGHDPDCEIDSSLAAAGIDAAAREEVRSRK